MIVVVFAVILIVLFMGMRAIYNGLLTTRQGIDNAFAQIDGPLTRRYELIASLVETAQDSMGQEKNMLEGVILARNIAQGALIALKSAPGNSRAVAALSVSESVLGTIMRKFMALSESYPDLKANLNRMQLAEALTSTENRVAFARQTYNDAVLEFNNRREVFPNNLVASMFGFMPGKVLEIADIQSKR